MKIGLFSAAGDKQACHLCSALNALSPGSALQFNLNLDPPARSSMSAAEATWGGVDLATLDAAVLRGFPYCDPVVPSGDLDVDWGLWRFEYIAEQQKYTYLYSLFSELERRGVKVVNPPSVLLNLFMKPFILERLRQTGLKVPELACTNDMAAARQFCGGHEHVMWRPAAGRAAWQLFLDRQREALISPRKPPIMLAEAIEGGPLCRGYLYDGQPLLFLKMAAPDCQGEERLEFFSTADCAAATAELRRLAETLSAPWLQVTFVLKDAQAWIYDLDADPLCEDLPALHRERLLALLAERLLRREPARQPDPTGEDNQERPTIFLRRMLRVLFEFQESKYKKEK
ncbi:MAG: hypothetical protein ABSE73_02975 [Planctomycetota bacterium]